MHHLTALVTLLAIGFYLFTAINVSRTRSRTGVKVPATSGHPDFERAFRIQANTLEWLPVFLPTLWLFAIYISGQDVTALYRRPELLWLIMPLMILWLCRVWLLASRGTLNEDPLVFALTDRMSLLIGVAAVVIVVLAI